MIEREGCLSKSGVGTELMWISRSARGSPRRPEWKEGYNVSRLVFHQVDLAKCGLPDNAAQPRGVECVAG